jgi:plasmid stabilization system protein ParE
MRWQKNTASQSLAIRINDCSVDPRLERARNTFQVQVKYRVRVTAKAEGDVDAKLSWFHQRAETDAGRRWFSHLMAKLATLETHPQRCAIASESDDVGDEIRELLFGKRLGVYRIIFKIEGRTVHILRVWHAARDRIKPEDL